MTELVLCCDLDRTVLPNGLQNESEHSRKIFADVIKACNITLVYVTGRDITLLQQAITEYQIPHPEYAIGDVGTSMYKVRDTIWQPIEAWAAHLATAWPPPQRDKLLSILGTVTELTAQEPEKQGPFKISYYTTPESLNAEFVSSLESKTTSAGFQVSIITSIDETTHTGLVDILPEPASKYHAIKFLLTEIDKPEQQVLFAGDSGNDLPVITSEIRSVLVNNAQPTVKTDALNLARQSGNTDACYIANGNWHGLNGHYTSGIIEGLVYYYPQLEEKIIPIIDGYRR